jgi:hypothetical protein
VLAVKVAVAIVLLVSGGAKLADITGFAAAIRLFVPARAAARHASALPVAAITIAAAELIAGGVSLCWPAVGWMNLAVLALCCGFAVVAGIGLVRHRGRPCHCFGALTRRGFSARTLLQALVIVAAAALACQQVHPAAQLRIGAGTHVLLLAAAGLLAGVACTAAKALANTATSGMVS